jgi:hypothetical protein
MTSPSGQHAAFLRMMDKFEGGLKSQIIADKKTFIHAATAIYREHGVPNFFHLVDKHQNAVFDTLKAHYRRIIPAFGALSLSEIKSRSFKATAEDALFDDLASEWVHTEGLKRSKMIADTSEADVLKAISDGMDEGEGTAAIADRISEVTDLSDWRSETIARTEVHAAANYASAESVRQAQEKLDIVMEKSWLATMDDRTREDHANMDPEEYIGMEELFKVGDSMMDRPGDPAGEADEVIGCRCVLGYREAKE